MIEYSDRERLEALNRHRVGLSVDSDTAFSIITQHVKNSSIEEFADILIHTEKFIEIYGESVTIYRKNTSLYSKRKEIFFNENRILTDEEHEACIKDDREYQNMVRDLTYNYKVQHDLKIKFPSLAIEIGRGNRIIVDGHIIKGIIISHYQEKLHDLSIESISK